ncbi:MAG TPA: protein kinase [Pyrinomonadaceae bacterium]|jgi:non-specific serine/threonine protein kinase/serine/threonine-protein kinase
MSESNWNKKKEIFIAVLDVPETRRADFLDENCGNNTELRKEVEKLLDAHSTNESFIEKPAFQIAPTFTDERLSGKQFGHYKIIREIGRGGMGAVFLAERSDGAFKQQVALKIVRQTILDSKTEKRFLRERQILASLNHPNIARLLDGGVSESGEPFLAMEYVEGKRIDEFCEEKALSTNERLKLFLAVCSAVSFAHQNLVVHRDIKPSNIIVAKDGTPKLLDFGIAKLLDAEHADEHTQTGYRAFTPEYASPEQITGEQITTASDVYSLGILLQHLVQIPKSKSQSPSDSNNKTNRQSTKTEDRRPKTELEAILQMAVREEPARRYASVQQFAEDIQRYLDKLPVTAQKDSFTYRAEKFIKRNKIPVFAAALIVLSLLAGLAASLWQANAARRQERLTREQRDRAERRFADVRQLANALLFDISPKIENLPGATEARQSVVTQSLKYLDSLAQEAGDDLQLQSELASAYEKIGDLQGNPTNPNLGDLAGAIASYEKAQKMRFTLLETNPNDAELRAALAANHKALGDIRWQANEIDESGKQVDAALNLYEKLAAENPDSPKLRLALAQINYDIGIVRTEKSNYAEAIAFYQKALNLVEPLRQSDPNNVQYLKVAGNCYLKLGNALSWNEQQKEAEVETTKAVQIYESLQANYPNDVSISNGLWSTYWMASNTYQDQNDALAHEYALKALKTIQSVVEKDPADIQARKRLARTYSTLGQTATDTGKPAEAVSYLEKSVSELGRRLESDPKSGGTKYDLGAALMRLAEARAKQKDYSGAFAELDKSERIYIELMQVDPSGLTSLRNQALIYDFRAEIYNEMAKTSAGEKRRAHEQNAKANYVQVVKILEQLAEKKSLPEFDRKWLEQLKAKVETTSSE